VLKSPRSAETSKLAGDRDRYFRPVDRFVHHGPPLDFRDLCLAAVPPSTRYLVFDLDRTLHLARNMGELLGWETAAYHSYGAEFLAAVEENRGPGRFLLAPSRPLATSKYLYRGIRGWTYPGLFYLLWGRIAGATAATRRMRARLFGEDAYLYIQTLPSLALLHDLEDMDLGQAEELATRVFRRQADDQVIDRSDIEWLRARCPGIQIILSSASPRPAVDAAAREMGIEAVQYMENQVDGGRYSAPFHMSPVFLHRKKPRRISPPSAYRVNSGRVKVQRLIDAFPDILDSETVGITDTWHGDDNCWSEHFTRVVDVNSISPFPPLVAVDSPIREIHSAQILTRQERAQRAKGDTTYLSPTRKRKGLAMEAACDLDGPAIMQRVADFASRAETLARHQTRLRASIADGLDAIRAEARQTLDRIEEVVAAYNDADKAARPRWLRSLGKLVRKHYAVRRRRARLEQPLSQIALELSETLAQARARLTLTPFPVIGHRSSVIDHRSSVIGHRS
jgi:hypothetical protein